MPGDRAEQISRIRNAIVEHLERNPRAADTSKGIAEFWLSRTESVRLPLVIAALEELQSRGIVSADTLADGTVIYRRAGPGLRS